MSCETVLKITVNKPDYISDEQVAKLVGNLIVVGMNEADEYKPGDLATALNIGTPEVLS